MPSLTRPTYPAQGRQLLFLVLALVAATIAATSAATGEPTALSVGCPVNSTYQSSTSDGKVDCLYDMTNCNDNPEFLWGPVGSLLTGGTRSAPCFGNLISGVTQVSGFSYVMGLYTEGDLPLDEETQAHIVRTSDGEVLASANILGLDSANDTDTYAVVSATFSQPPTLDPSVTYALYFCYVANASQYSDIYIVNLFQSQVATLPTHAAACLQYEDTGADAFPCFTFFNLTASRDVFNEFATTINFDCPADPSPSASPSPSPTPSPSPSTSRSPSSSASPHLPSASASPTSSPSRSPSPSSSPITSVPAVSPLANVSATFSDSGPGLTLSSTANSNAVSASASFGGIGGGGLALNITSFNITTQTVNGVVTRTYTTTIGNSVLSLGYQYHKDAAPVSFGNSTYPLPPGAAKWTVEVTGGWPFGSANSFQVNNTISVTAGATIEKVLAVPNQPIAQMTTYLIYTHGSSVGIELQTFDFALADGAKVAMMHNVAFLGSSATFSLTFSRFQNNLVYDPSLSMVSIVQPSPSSQPNKGTSGGGDNTALAVGLGVGLGGGFLLCLLLLVIAGAVVFFVRKKGGGRFDISIFSSDV